MGEMGEERQVKGEDRNHAGNPWGLCLAAVSFLIFLKECSQTDSRQSAECLLGGGVEASFMKEGESLQSTGLCL